MSHGLVGTQQSGKNERALMRAVVVRETGGPDALRIESVLVPAPAPRDVLIRVAACGVCTLDVVMWGGAYRRGVELTLIHSHEVAEIDDVHRKMEPGSVAGRIVVRLDRTNH